MAAEGLIGLCGCRDAFRRLQAAHELVEHSVVNTKRWGTQGLTRIPNGPDLVSAGCGLRPVLPRIF